MSYGSETLALSPGPVARSHATIREASTSLPQGPSAPVELCCLAHHGLYDPMRQSHRHAAISRQCPYAQRLRCAGAPRRPAGPSLLSLLLFLYVPSTLSRQVRQPSCPVKLVSGSRLPRSLNESPPTTSVSASNTRRCLQFRDCSDHFMLRPVCLPSTPGWLQQDEVICSSPCLLSTLSLPLLTLSVTGQRWESG